MTVNTEQRRLRKVLLINPSTKAKILAPPLGLVYLASYARNVFPDCQFKLFDFGVFKKSMEEQAKIIAEEKPDIVGITAMTPNFSSALNLAEVVKKINPSIIVILGGVHVSAVGKPNSPFQDSVVLGEGEQAFVELLQMHQSGNPLPKVHTTDFIKDIDFFPAWDLVDFSNYSWFSPSKYKSQAVVYWSRGCPFNCTFCPNVIWKPQKVRFRTPENIVDELELLQKKYKIKEVYVFDDEINTNPDWLIQVCDEIVKRNLNIVWKCQMRASERETPDQLFTKVKEAGCWHIAWGIESGENYVLKHIRKHLSTGEVYRALKLSKDVGITNQGLFMLGNIWYDQKGKPAGETYEDCRKTIDFAKKLRDLRYLDYVQFNIATPYPGSEMWDIVQRFNLLRNFEGWDGWGIDTHTVLFNHPALTEQDILKLHREAWMTFSFSFSLLLSHLFRIRNFDDIYGLLRSARVACNVILTGHPRKGGEKK